MQMRCECDTPTQTLRNEYNPASDDNTLQEGRGRACSVGATDFSTRWTDCGETTCSSTEQIDRAVCKNAASPPWNSHLANASGDRQTDRQMDASQHCLMSPYLIAGKLQYLRDS